MNLDSGATSATPFRYRWTRVVAGYVIGAACLVWLFHEVDLGEIVQNLRHLRWELVAAAVILDASSYACQGLRWKLLLDATVKVSWFETTQATYIGLFASEVLPMRAGELVRAWVIARAHDISVSAVLPSVIGERLFDGVWLAAGLTITAMFVPLPRDLQVAAAALGAVIVAAAAILSWFARRLSLGNTNCSTAGQRTKSPRAVRLALWQLASSLQAIRHSPTTWLSFGLSMFLPFGQVFAFWMIGRAYGLRLSFWVASAVVFIIRLGTAVPNAPANVGTYQFFTVVGLTLFGVDRTVATGFSIVVFIILTVPLWVFGYAALVHTNVALHVFRDRLAAEHQDDEGETSPQSAPHAR